MGLGTFLKKLFGGEKPAAETTYTEPTTDAVKDATDYAIPRQELVSESAQPVMETKSALEDDSNENAQTGKQDFVKTDRIEEDAD